MSVIVIVFGSRHWDHFGRVQADILELHEGHGDELLIVHGAASAGADDMAHRACLKLGVAVAPMPAEWRQHDRRSAAPIPCSCPTHWDRCKTAGVRRNQRMIDTYGRDIGRAIGYRASGDSPGTDDMATRCVEAGIRTHLVPHPDAPPIRVVRGSGTYGPRRYHLMYGPDLFDPTDVSSS